jgi:hypothetical protein
MEPHPKGGGARSMRLQIVMMVSAALFTACAARETTPAETPASTSLQGTGTSEDGNRPLNKRECDSLAQVIVDGCNNRGNDRFTGVDGWCSDMLRRTADGSWIGTDCRNHVKYLDSVCFRGANNVHAMMDCDRNVDRSK